MAKYRLDHPSGSCLGLQGWCIRAEDLLVVVVVVNPWLYYNITNKGFVTLPIVPSIRFSQIIYLTSNYPT